MILRACEVGVEERGDLDWKAQLPLTASDPEGKQTQQAELAKDIAAGSGRRLGCGGGASKVWESGRTPQDRLDALGTPHFSARGELNVTIAY
jgi:hypothetical protein